MKHRYTALTGIVLGAALLLSAIGCTGAPAGSGNATSAQETQPAAPEPDTRQLTDTTAYKARLSNSFEGIEPATAAELTFTADADGVTITGYTGGATVLVIPAELDGKPVVAVGEGAFRGAVVRALSLPDSLRRIGFGALEKCRELVTLRTPLLCADGKDWFASLFGADSYMSGATAVPAKLTTLILTGGADLRTVPDYCFYGCTGLETVGLPAGVETVGAFAFYGAGSLAYVSLPDSLRRVGEYAFANCQTLPVRRNRIAGRPHAGRMRTAGKTCVALRGRGGGCAGDRIPRLPVRCCVAYTDRGLPARLAPVGGASARLYRRAGQCVLRVQSPAGDHPAGHSGIGRLPRLLPVRVPDRRDIAGRLDGARR